MRPNYRSSCGVTHFWGKLGRYPTLGSSIFSDYRTSMKESTTTIGPPAVMLRPMSNSKSTLLKLRGFTVCGVYLTMEAETHAMQYAIPRK